MSNSKYLESDNFYSMKKVNGLHKELPSGCYTIEYDPDHDQVSFIKFEPNCDAIVDLPSSEYNYIVKQMEHFLKPATKAKFADYGFVYKRSALLHGAPGTGKTVIVNRIMVEALKNNSIVLFNPDPRLLDRIYRDVNTTDKDKMCLVVFEEFDGIINKGPQFEEALLSILDGEIQKQNVMYLATTNYIDAIPARLKRPGRFGSLIKVGFPTAEARAKYLQVKNIPLAEINAWVKKTENFSIDELKETVLAVKCLDYTLDSVIERINENKTSTEYADKEKIKDDDEYSAFQNTMMKMMNPRATVPRNW